jgi:organic hydroperoxide reductase OsmC/OhrA
VPEPRAKVLDYAVGLGHDGGWLIDDGVERLGERWTAEHLVLAALVRCSLTSLAYHARRGQIAVTASRGDAYGKITKRDSDGRYAFVEIGVRLEVSLEPPCDDVEALLAKAERDCFIGASLSVKPEYRWRVNGAENERPRSGRL